MNTFFLLCCLLTHSIQVDEPPDVDLFAAYNSKSQLLLSEFAERVEYVVLETGTHPIDKGLKVYISGNYLVCIAFRQIYLFDRQSGKFIREISRYGRGPDEYQATLFFDGKTQRVIVIEFGGNLYEFNLDGRMTRKIIVPRKENTYGTREHWTLN